MSLVHFLRWCPLLLQLELLIPVTVGHFCILTEGESLLLDVVQLVHPLLPRDKLGNGGADTQRANIIIGLAGSPLLWWNNLYTNCVGGKLTVQDVPLKAKLLHRLATKTNTNRPSTLVYKTLIPGLYLSDTTLVGSLLLHILNETREVAEFLHSWRETHHAALLPPPSHLLRQTSYFFNRSVRHWKIQRLLSCTTEKLSTTTLVSILWLGAKFCVCTYKRLYDVTIT